MSQLIRLSKLSKVQQTVQHCLPWLQSLCLLMVALLSIALVQRVSAHNAAHGLYHPSFQESPLSPLSVPDTQASAQPSELTTVTDTTAGDTTAGDINSDEAASGDAESEDRAEQAQSSADSSQGVVTIVDRPITSGSTGNQTSLVLVGAILVGMIIVAGLAIWRRT